MAIVRIIIVIVIIITTIVIIVLVILIITMIIIEIITEGAVVFDIVVRREKRCAYCGEPARKKCSACKAVRYCNRQCQRDAWKNHRAQCVPILQ